MDYKFIKHQLDEGVKIIVFNRSQVLNSFNKEMGKELRTELENSRDDENVRSILITAEGKAFCAGQDLNEVVEDGEIKNPVSIVTEIYNPIIQLIRTIEKPVICAVNGIAAGAGANIALSCDIVIASDKASFIQAFTRIGLIPDSGGTFFLPRLIGLQRTSALVMLNDKLTAQEAFQIGLIYKVFSHELLNESSIQISKELAKMPTKSIGLIKQALNQSFNNSLEQQLSVEAQLQEEAGKTNDYQEGVKAFLEKRKANFIGK